MFTILQLGIWYHTMLYFESMKLLEHLLQYHDCYEMSDYENLLRLHLQMMFLASHLMLSLFDDVV